LLDSDQIIFINPMVVIDKGSQFSVDFGNGAIERVRLARCRDFNQA